MEPTLVQLFEKLQLPMCLCFLAGSIVYSVSLFVRHMQQEPTYKQYVYNERGATMDSWWRRVVLDWRRKKYFRSIRRFFGPLFGAYRRWKFLSWVGKLDFLAVSFFGAVALEAAGRDTRVFWLALLDFGCQLVAAVFGLELECNFRNYI